MCQNSFNDQAENKCSSHDIDSTKPVKSSVGLCWIVKLEKAEKNLFVQSRELINSN